MSNLSIPGKLPQELVKATLLAEKRRRFHYYREEHGIAARRILDKLHASGNTIRVPVTTYAAQTLRLQYYHGCYWLLDNADPKGVYRDLYAKTKCVTYKDFVEFHVKSPSSGLDAAEELIPWREDFTNFLETAVPNAKFFRENLKLTAEELSWIGAQLAPLIRHDDAGNEIPLFYGEIKEDHILLIKDEIPESKPSQS